MSINPGQRTNSIYQQDEDAFSSQLNSSNARHLLPHAKANGQVNRLSKVFDGPKDQQRPPPPPPSKPQALRSAARRSSRTDEMLPVMESLSRTNDHPTSRPLSAASTGESAPDPDSLPDPPTLSFKDLQAKFQQATIATQAKAPVGRPKWQINTATTHTPSALPIDTKPKYPNSPVSGIPLDQFNSSQTAKYDSDQYKAKDRSSAANIPRLVKSPIIAAKPPISVASPSSRDITNEISKRLERGPPPTLLEKSEDMKPPENRQTLPSSPSLTHVYKSLPTLPTPPISRPQVRTRPDPIITMASPDAGLGKSSQRKAWMVNSMKAAAAHGPMSSPVSSSLASTPSLEIPIARSATGNSVSSTTSSSSTSSQANGGQNKRGRGYSGFGSLFGGGSSSEDHHQSIKNSITIISREPIQQRDSISSTGSTRPPSSAEVTPYTSQPVSPLLDGRDPAAKRSMKRYNVVKELVETERAYRNDMILLKQVYFDGGLSESSPLDKADVKQLFSNLPTIVEFETEFLALLETSCNIDGDGIDDNESDATLTDHPKGDEQASCIGMAYITMMPQIEQIYCDYCKRHETAVLRLQELECKPEVQAFFKSCQQAIQDRTTSWDLGSMLIKPVQRVLKYPLLLQQIRTLTDPTHPDFVNLERATKEIQEVADRINEIKRRKDIVEKIVGDRRRTDVSMVHGINKTFTRRAQKFKQATGIAAEGTQDALFDALFAKFEEQQESAKQLARDVQGWLRHVKENFEAIYQLAITLEDLYTSWGGVTVKSLERIKAFKECAASFISSLSRELETLVRSIVYTRIDSFLMLFNNPSQVIVKRSNKLIDHDRANGIKQKGGIPDKALQESADAYVSINAQLVDELPRFLALTTQYFDLIVEEFAGVQAQFNKLMTNEWKRYMFKGSYAIADTNIESMTLESITEAYNLALQELEPSIEEIVAINPPQWESVPGFQSSGGSDSTGTTPSLPPLDQYFGSSFGGLRTPSRHSLPLSEGTASSYRKAPQRTGSNFSHDTAPLPPTMQVTQCDDTWSDSSSFAVGDRPLFERVIMFDCNAEDRDQLSVRQGDVVTIWQADDDEWWYASSTHTVTGEESWGWVLAAACK